MIIFVDWCCYCYYCYCWCSAVVVIIIIIVFVIKYFELELKAIMQKMLIRSKFSFKEEVLGNYFKLLSHHHCRDQ